MPQRVGIISLGCAKNLVDSERMLGVLAAAGYEITQDTAGVDVLLVNTCGFIEAARDESRAVIGEAMQGRMEGKYRALVVTGCLPQLCGDELVREFPAVDAFAPVRAAGSIVALVERVLSGERTRLTEAGSVGAVDRLPRVLATLPSTAYLRVADGCENHCSYCIIPLIRGRRQSRPLEDVVGEARELARRGVQELVLIAQDTTAYGHDRGENQDLAAVVRALGRLPVPWVRVMYAHPGHLTDSLVEAMASAPNCCHYLDLPLQHASDRVLKAMNRPDSEVSRRAVDRLRTWMPDVALRTTMLVGFPGETERDFATLLAFLAEVRFDHLGAFAYSPEVGTQAASLAQPVPQEVAQERLHRLMLLQRGIAAEKNRERVGQKLPVLIEQKKCQQLHLGRAYHQAPEVDGWVLVQGGQPMVGSLVPVRLIGTATYDLLGRPV